MKGESGQEPDLTDKWILRHMKPSMIIMYALAMIAVITAGNTMEAGRESNGEPVDEIKEANDAKKSRRS